MNNESSGMIANEKTFYHIPKYRTSYELYVTVWSSTYRIVRIKRFKNEKCKTIQPRNLTI